MSPSSRRTNRLRGALAAAAFLLAVNACTSEVQYTWTAAGHMINSRNLATATLLKDGSVLVTGGEQFGGQLRWAERYRPPDGSWVPTGDMTEIRAGHTATLLKDGRVLVVGGYFWTGVKTALATAELYDPRSGTWIATGKLRTPRKGHTATLLPDGRVLVAGGFRSAHANPDVSQASAELFDPQTGSWTPAGEMLHARYFATATLLPDGTVLVAGGRNAGGALSTAEIYDPGSGTWSSTGPMVGARYDATATLLADGSVLATGGSDSLTNPLATAERYDPQSRTWSAVAGMGVARIGHSATLLTDGHILVVGGAVAGGGLLSSTELYDPRDGTWKPGGEMIVPRAYQTATLLADGRVLVTGGGGADAQAAAEVYRPAE